ncbi:LysM peptidoglycan-binding domain-containing protein [Dethiothermospora halolimnae]|uniref:LysM peptidoglycan-binding domain-containing protein n=1 Tax=Dethiothermospora halolimnae TaxID=3114390 RepID=UPI003CCBD4FF
MRKKYVIVNKTRFTIFITILFLILLFILTTALNLDAVYSRSYNKHHKVVVRRGDTLWNIARDNNHNNEDIRRVLHNIIEYNDIKETTVFPGDIIKVPY